MSKHVRPLLTAGVAAMTAFAVAVVPSAPEPSQPQSTTPAVRVVSQATLQLAAAVDPLALTAQPPLLDILLSDPLRLFGPAAPLGTLPPPPAPAQFAIAPNLANTIDSIYIAVEPWVQYGFEVATAVVRWIPWVGWFAGQIMVFNNFFESMVASGVFNFTDWLRGDGGAIENLVDFGIDVGLAFVWLGLDEVAQFIPLPPFCCYPPRPPVQGPFSAFEALSAPTDTDMLTMAASIEDQGQGEQPGAEFLTEETVTEETVTVTEETVVEEEDATEQETVTEEKTVSTLEEPGLRNATEQNDATTDLSGTISAQGEIRGSGADAVTDDDAAINDQITADARADQAKNSSASARVHQDPPTAGDGFGTGSGSGAEDGASGDE